MFSNGTEYMIWQARNCDRCAKYENKSVKVEDASCRIAFYIDYGAVTGELPPDVEETADRRDCPESGTSGRKARREQRVTVGRDDCYGSCGAVVLRAFFIARQGLKETVLYGGKAAGCLVRTLKAFFPARSLTEKVPKPVILTVFCPATAAARMENTADETIAASREVMRHCFLSAPARSLKVKALFPFIYGDIKTK